MDTASAEQNRYGYTALQTGFTELSLPDGFICRSLEGELDFQKPNRCIWRGFHHGDPGAYDIDAQRHMERPHYMPSFGRIVAVTDGEYACVPGLWYDDKNRYAYLEPLCTQPQYRRTGLARYALNDVQ